MATAKLIGAASADSGSNDHNSNMLCLTQFQAEVTGIVSEIKVKASATGNVKVSIYADSGGEPSSLLVSTGSNAVVAGWNTISISSASLTEYTYYWLAVKLDTPGAAIYNNASGTMRYKTPIPFADAWPDPAGSGFISGSFHGLLAGWGVLVLSPSGIAQAIALGSPKLNLTILPSGIAQLIALGTPTVVTAGQTIQPSGIEQLVALGTPTVIKLLQILYPSGVNQPLAIGTPALRYPQTLSPSGIAQLVVFGTPSVGVYGFISPPSIVSLISVGLPTILKYVWHVILDGQYATETTRINRAYVIGRDIYGNPVYGTAVDSTELGLVGERLDFQQELAIPTDALAEDTAEAILAKMRLSGKGGVILIPPNCGQELFDVVQVTDSQGNQSAVKFRVVGLRFEYNPKQARYQHRLTLGAP